MHYSLAFQQPIFTGTLLCRARTFLSLKPTKIDTTSNQPDSIRHEYYTIKRCYSKGMKPHISDQEYTSIRQEIIQRAVLLHQILLWAAILIFIVIAVLALLLSLDSNANYLQLFLLTAPIAFACLTFNYQANQMTLEGLSYYLTDHDPHTGWDGYYAKHKRKNEAVSFLKVLPLLLPQLLPILYFCCFNNGASSGFNLIAIFDLFLFLLVILNFRYKLR